MGWVGVHARVPHRGNRDFRGTNRKIEPDEGPPDQITANRPAQTRARHKRDQVGIARNAQRVREARYDGDDLSTESQRLEGLVDRPGEGALA